jgi:hypothetical protein
MQQQYATIFACREMIQIEDGWMVWSVVEQNSDFRVLSTSRFRHKCQQMKITDHYVPQQTATDETEIYLFD